MLYEALISEGKEFQSVPDFSFENQAEAEGFGVICGIDEAGRGPWAGPVTAAAVVLPKGRVTVDVLAGLDDSKKLKSARREALYAALKEQAHIGVGEASVREIDELNILQATFLAMRRAVEAIDVAVDLALIDGNKLPNIDCPARAIVKGDGKSLSIAAASIIAKVHRDRTMQALSERFPGYGWERNAGYGTTEHRQALAALGVTPAHRKSYAPIRKILGHASG